MARQDPVKVDPNHYTVAFENRQVRVLRIRYGPGEQSVLHGHPAGVGVHLTDAHVRFTFPTGNAEDMRVAAGEVRSYPAGDHVPQNLSDRPLELVMVELKPRPVIAKKPAPPRRAAPRKAARKKVAKKSARRR